MQAKSQQQIRKIIASMVTSDIGSEILTFAIGLLILNQTESALNFGISQVIGPLISLFLLPVKGSLIDKYNKKLILTLSQLLSFAGMIIFALSFDGQTLPSLFFVYLFLVILEISDQFYGVAIDTSISSLVLNEDIQKVQSIRQIFNALSAIVVPIAAILLMNVLSLHSMVYVSAGLEIITILILLTLDFTFNPEAAEASEDPEALDQSGLFQLFKEGLDLVKNYRKLTFAVVFAMLVNLLLAGVNVGLPYLQITILDFSDMAYAISQSLFALGLILSAIYLSNRDNYEYPLHVSVQSVYYLALTFIILGLSLFFNLNDTAYVFIVHATYFFIGLILIRVNVPGSSWMMERIPKDYQGRVFSLMNTLGELLMPLGIFIFSLLFEYLAARWIFLGIGAFIMIVVTLMIQKGNIDLKDNELY